MRENIKYSVLMSVYYKENPVWLKESIQSMLDQTIKCNEFVIVKDGPITKELDLIINEFVEKKPELFRVISLEKNLGLGLALKIGVENCSNEWIARMDSDDYSKPYRLEKTIEFIKKHPEVDLVGSWHNEFSENKSNIISIKKLPETNDEIIQYSKRRNPFSHPSVFIRKQKIIEAGNFRGYHLVEDYDMWIRMIRNGCKCYNIQEDLISVRVSGDLYKRRGGIKYLKSILKFKFEMYNVGHMNFFDFIVSSLSSIIVCLIPSFLREIIYKKVLR
ncbi:MAG: glycosyltransferase [Clostridium celatum]|nr:glycosyltransferase [Clostridium celatum]